MAVFSGCEARSVPSEMNGDIQARYASSIESAALPKQVLFEMWLEAHRGARAASALQQCDDGRVFRHS